MGEEGLFQGPQSQQPVCRRSLFTPSLIHLRQHHERPGPGTKRCGSTRERAGIPCSGIGHLFRPAGVDEVLGKIRRVEGDAFWRHQSFGD